MKQIGYSVTLSCPTPIAGRRYDVSVEIPGAVVYSLADVSCDDLHMLMHAADATGTARVSWDYTVPPQTVPQMLQTLYEMAPAPEIGDRIIYRDDPSRGTVLAVLDPADPAIGSHVSDRYLAVLFDGMTFPDLIRSDETAVIR